MSTLAISTADAAQKGAAAKPKFEVGTIAALGVAVGGITAAIGALLSALFGLGYWIPLGIAGLVLAISGPSMILAWLKLRTRNLGPILDANGWAVNGHVRINFTLGAEMTRLGRLPANAHRIHGDPFAERSFPWLPSLLLLGLILLAGWLGWRYREAISWSWTGCGPAQEQR